MVTSLVRAEEAFSNDELVEWLRRRLGDELLDVVDEFETLTVVVSPAGWVDAHRVCKEDDRLAFAMFDSLFGVDAKDEGFDVVSILYSVEMGRRLLRDRVHRCVHGTPRLHPSRRHPVRPRPAPG